MGKWVAYFEENGGEYYGNITVWCDEKPTVIDEHTIIAGGVKIQLDERIEAFDRIEDKEDEDG